MPFHADVQPSWRARLQPCHKRFVSWIRSGLQPGHQSPNPDTDPERGSRSLTAGPSTKDPVSACKLLKTTSRECHSTPMFSPAGGHGFSRATRGLSPGLGPGFSPDINPLIQTPILSGGPAASPRDPRRRTPSLKANLLITPFFITMARMHLWPCFDQCSLCCRPLAL